MATRTDGAPPTEREAIDRELSMDRAEYSNQAFRALQVGFVLAPIIAGVDKFTEILTNWTQYLWTPFANAVSITPEAFMGIVGVIEIAAGILVALSPRIGGYVVAAWLAGIIVNLLLVGGYADIALRDLGLAIGAFALARLATARDVTAVRTYMRSEERVASRAGL